LRKKVGDRLSEGLWFNFSH